MKAKWLFENINKIDVSCQTGQEMREREKRGKAIKIASGES